MAVPLLDMVFPFQMATLRPPNWKRTSVDYLERFHGMPRSDPFLKKRSLLDRLASAFIETIAATLSVFAFAADRACKKVSLHGLEESEEQEPCELLPYPAACQVFVPFEQV
jgi:hypothetical protein